MELSAATQFLSPLESIQTPQVAENSGQADIATERNISNDMQVPINYTATAPDNDMSLFDHNLLADFYPSNFEDNLFNDIGQL